MPVELGSFDVIIGMDSLVKYHAVIICDEKIVRIPFGNEILIIRGDGSNNGYESRLNIISCTKTQKYLLKGCDVFLAHVTIKKAEDKSKEKRLEDVPIVQDFLEVFPEDLPDERIVESNAKNFLELRLIRLQFSSPCGALAVNTAKGVNKTELLRILAGQLLMVAAMADASSLLIVSLFEPHVKVITVRILARQTIRFTSKADASCLLIYNMSLSLPVVYRLQSTQIHETSTQFQCGLRRFGYPKRGNAGLH
ncbi:hypothetical protein Tco_0899045 [Tanacetum coccineum]